MNINKKTHQKFIFLGVAFLLGTLSIIAFRFITYRSTDVHYHANFALYINGRRDELKSFTFYEEVSACTVHDSNNPKIRVHMHDQNNGLVHVHAEGATWGYFFANLGYTLGDKLIGTDSVFDKVENKGYTIYADGKDGNQLSFILNGKKISNIANVVIASEDRLLIDYGKTSQEKLDQLFATVPTDAHKANTERDPASCGGGHQATFLERLKKSIYH